MNITNDQDGGIEGDDNLYGIGVRAGFYLQWAALLLAYQSVPSQFKNMLNTITVFQLAFLITLIWKTASSNAESPLFDLEAFLTLIYGVGGGFGSMSYALAQNTERLRIRRAEDLYVNFITLCFTAYALWFWFAGIHRLPRLPYTAYVFFFYKVPLHGWFIVFNQVIVVMTTLASSVALLIKLWGIYDHWEHLALWLLGDGTRRASFRPDSGTKRKYVVWALVLAFTMLVVVVELTIEWNSLTGVNNLQSTGQLIPLIIGITALVQMLLRWRSGSGNEGL